MARMTMAREQRQDWEVIRLSGIMTEEAGVQLLSLYDEPAKKFIFNLSGVTAINSNGVRSWMIFFRDFRQERELIFEECSPAVVMQMNMLASFALKARITSVYATFECAGCRTTTEALLQARDFPPPGTGAKPVRCKGCGSMTEAGDDTYFEFLK